MHGLHEYSDIAVCHRYQLLQEMTSQFPSGLSQSAFVAIVKAWGEQKLHQHLQQVPICRYMIANIFLTVVTL